MKKYLKVNKTAYNNLSKQYQARLGKKSFYEEPLENLVGLPLKYAKERFDSIHALDVGPGRGEACMYISNRGFETTAIDIAEKMLEVVENISPKIKTICGDILDYPFDNESFELVYCGALIHLFPKEDAKKLMDKIFKILKQKGILFVNTTIHSKSSEGYYTKNDYRGKIKRFRHRYTENEFLSLVQGAGFNIIDRINTEEKDRNKNWLALICEK
jgi:ubiquinone/menaquinone biosynthesis C-methylase UbiE